MTGTGMLLMAVGYGMFAVRERFFDSDVCGRTRMK
jgi:hypothetical protein